MTAARRVGRSHVGVALALVVGTSAACRERAAKLDARAAAISASGSGATSGTASASGGTSTSGSTPGVTSAVTRAGATASTSGLPEPATTRVLYPGAPGSFAGLVADARHGVVAIRAASPVAAGPAAMFPGAPEQAADVALGTGFLVDAHGLYVLTNDHIASASTELHVVLPDGADVPARLVGRDTRLDVALLQLAPPAAGSDAGAAALASAVAHLAPLPLGHSDALQVGEWLVVLGDPFGDEVTASVGVVSATGREAAGSLAAGPASGFRTYLQTDARIHRGNSGGPVLDSAGQVVGIAVATGDRVGELSFAIPIDRVRDELDQLRDTGGVTRGWLGILVQPVTPELAQSLALPRPTGALVTEVRAGSPAARTQLRAGDVILAWDGRDVDHRTLPWLIASAPVGKPIQITVWRDHAAVPITVTTEPMPQ